MSKRAGFFLKGKRLEDHDGLHIVEKAKPVTGAEFRFLRKQLELTQTQPERLRVPDQTIANYEKENTTNLGPADPLTRGAECHEGVVAPRPCRFTRLP